MDKSKRSKKVRYWVSYRIPNGKQRREFVGYSITEARAADGKRRAQKHEHRIYNQRISEHHEVFLLFYSFYVLL